MSKHTLVFRISPDDTGPSNQQFTNATTTEVAYPGFAEVDHQLGGIVHQLHKLGLQPSERAFDLVILSAAITAADTRIARAQDAQDRWTREIELCLPVAEPAVWHEVQDLLQRTLNFLTGDIWTLTFRARAPSVSQLIPPATDDLIEKPTSVCLFSGGLDSFIGVIDLLSKGERPLLVSHYWDPLTSAYQTTCLKELKARFGEGSFESIRARIGFPTGTIGDSTNEDTLRARSFLFFSLAALTATAMGKDLTIHVPENGLISLNVPLDPLRLGALSTRTTHPYYMARFNETLQKLGLGTTLVNQYRHRTKGQMVAECADIVFLRENAAHTISCSSPAKMRYSPDEHRRQPKNCGHCVPCLIRRAALLHGLGEDKTDYQEPLEGRELDSETAVGSHVRSFQLALSRLRRRPMQARFDIHKPGPLIDFPDDWDHYEQVYRDGLEEVGALLRNVRSRPRI